MTQSPFFQSAPALRHNGYSVIPDLPHSKKPAIERWPEFGVNPADEKLFNRWMRWKDINISVCMGVASNLIAIDFDNDAEDLHAKIKSIIPPSPVRKKGSKGETWFYQFNGQRSQSFSKDGNCIIEILSQGRKTTVPASQHPDGHPYTWLTDKTLENTMATELPNLSMQHVLEISALFGSKNQTTHIEQPRNTYVYNETALEEVAEALTYIPADEYELWIRIGMGLREKFGEKAFSVWDRWSSTCADKYKPREMRAKWQSFNGHGITIASIFYHALDNGYTSVPTDYLDPVNEEFILDGKKTGFHRDEIPAPLAEPAPIEIQSEPIPDEIVPKKTDLLEFPAELLKAPGLPGILSAFINRTSLKPQPILALGAALAASGALMGRKVRSETNIRTNLYIMGLAPSGSGKDHARTIIKRLFHDTNMGNLELGVPASSAGLITSLTSAEGRGIILWDEFGRILKQIMGFKAGTHERDIVTAMIELFSSSQSIYMGKAYANHDGKKPSRPIDQPCLSVYGTSVPSHFYEALSGADAIDGFMSRWLLFESKDYVMEEEEREDVFDEIPQAMLDVCKYWKEAPFNSNPGTGNLADATRVVPKLIACSKAAQAHLKAFNTETSKLAYQREKAGEPTGAIWSRAGEHARRLALVACEGDVIELKVAEWAVKLARYLCEYMSFAISDYVSSTELEAQTKRVLRCLRDKKSVNDGWMTRAEVTRTFQGIQARTRNEILASLIERGEVFEEKQASTGGRAKIRYRAI